LKNNNKLELYQSNSELNDPNFGVIASELMLARKLLNTLKGVAIFATDAKFNIHYANQYAVDIFNLNLEQVHNAKAALPRLVKKRLSSEVKQGQHEFVLQYSVDSALRSLQVFCKADFTLNDQKNDFVFHMHDITDRIGVESQLRSADLLLRNVIDASPDFIHVKDEKGRWLLTNKSSLNLFGIPSHRYQFKTDQEVACLIDPSFKQTFQDFKKSDEAAWEANYVVRHEKTVPMPYGGEKVFDIYKVAIFNEDGSRQGLVTIGRDITERKLAELHLRDRSSILDALISCDWMLHSSASWETVAPKVLEQICTAARFSRVSIFKNNQPNNLQANRYAEQFLQWYRPGLKSITHELNMIDFNSHQFQRWLEILQHGNTVFGGIKELPELEYKTLKRFSIESIMVVPIFTGKVWWGNIVIERHEALTQFTPQELGTLMAISRSLGVAIEKESTGKSLQQAKIAFDSASEGIMIIDADTNIIAINHGFTVITGFSEKEMLGTTPKIFTVGDHEIWVKISKEGRWKGEVQNQRKNGEIYQEWLTLTAVKDPKGNVINYVGVFADITEIKASQLKLNKLVNHDVLTGLPNRRLVTELLGHAIKRSERSQQNTAVLFIDLDRFKAINDSLGHEVGDKLLHQVSSRISLCMRDSDVVARLGGDEFLVVMNFITKPDDAALVAQKIIQELRREFIIDGKEIFIGASVGIAIAHKDGKDVETLIKAADIAMYQVKNRGKNNYCFYSEELSSNAIERFTLENQLRRALERNQFELYYQPQVSIEDREIIGAEALIRWNHPELGLVSPAKFIPVAEETGLIVQIGEWVLRESALQVLEWNAQGLAIQWISVNVSGVQIMKGNFADLVYGILIETDCDPSMIELEITESTIMNNTDYVIDTFKHIKKLGIRLAIDDFGTGYSSLSNLKRLPLDKIKIDQSFVKDLPHDLDDAVITNTINAMARSLGFDVIAEGVENEEQAEFLKNIGCNKAQGYLYGRALDVAAFTELLKNNKLEVKRND